MLELNVSWPMSAISKTYNCTHNILDLKDVLPNASFTASETELDYYHSKFELTDELPNNVRLKKISELHKIKV